MHRTQIYIEDTLWATLQRRARVERCSVSELIRQSARDRYEVDHKKRAAAVRAAVGLWKDRDEIDDVESHVRSLRKGAGRRERLEA